jgi:NitT/TauT family transport system ATP-binding protein
MTSSFAYTKNDTLITIDNVSVTLGGNVILKNLSAQIKDIVRPGVTQGQIVALLGPSGCGKTTLFKVLAGLSTPDEGSVTVGHDHKPVEAGKVGVVAQNYPLLNHRTVLGNLVFAAAQSGQRGAQAVAAARAKLEEFDLLEHAAKYPIQLSGGQRQRVAIAQQLICSEHYLIMDEPFSGLDEVAKKKVIDLIKTTADRNEENTFIIVTHDIASAVNVADTIWLMGRDRDLNGVIIPGARIMDTIDLIDRDICWHPSPEATPAGAALIQQIKEVFPKL